MQSRPRLTGLSSSPATASTLPSFTPTMTPQPTPQKRQGAFVQESRGSSPGAAGWACASPVSNSHSTGRKAKLAPVPVCIRNSRRGNFMGRLLREENVTASCGVFSPWFSFSLRRLSSVSGLSFSSLPSSGSSVFSSVVLFFSLGDGRRGGVFRKWPCPG